MVKCLNANTALQNNHGASWQLQSVSLKQIYFPTSRRSCNLALKSRVQSEKIMNLMRHILAETLSCPQTGSLDKTEEKRMLGFY